jgi:trehalose 6-phosphate synthase
LVKEQCPEARVAIFWHIPWPNPEAFRICPWQQELLEGMLGADLVGFHIQAHCNNFLDSADSALECRIDREHFAVNRQGHSTLVRPFPISVAFPDDVSSPEADDSVYLRRAALLKHLGVSGAFLGVGVDRVDYTKGIIERFRAVERFLEKYPGYRRQFTFLQIGAPSRTTIKRYQDLLQEVADEASRINARFQTSSWRPIVLLKRQYSHAEVDFLFKASDMCLVTSLHDGMNLVAKEFVAARDDEDGVLILSCFTGASRELRDALIINPYNTEQLADSIYTALTMDPEERQTRMRRMRRVVREHNVFGWAGALITELAKIPLEKTEVAASS